MPGSPVCMNRVQKVKHEEEKKELLRKLSDLVRRESQGDWWPAGAERVAGRTAVAR